jgi:ribosome-associated protein
MANLTTHEKARAIVEAALERKAENAIALDVSELTSFTEVMVILTGRSDRQVRAIADGVTRAMKALGDRPLGVEGLNEAHWVLIDCNDVICHVFDPEARGHYALERLWADGDAIELPEGASEAQQDDPAPTHLREVGSQ